MQVGGIGPPKEDPLAFHGDYGVAPKKTKGRSKASFFPLLKSLPGPRQEVQEPSSFAHPPSKGASMDPALDDFSQTYRRCDLQSACDWHRAAQLFKKVDVSVGRIIVDKRYIDFRRESPHFKGV